MEGTVAEPQNAHGQRPRAAARPLKSGVGALALGMALLLAPALWDDPLARALAQGPAWLVLAGGLGMLAFHRLPRRFGAASAAAPGEASHALPAAEAVVREGPSNPGPDAPPRPVVWSEEVFQLIEWRRFDALCEKLFEQAGFQAREHARAAEGGNDILLYSNNQPDGPVSLLRCKHGPMQPVGVAELLALLDSMALAQVKRGIFTTASTFATETERLAQHHHVQLLDRGRLLELIDRRTPEQQAELLAVATQEKFWVPTCPSCGLKMARRAARTAGTRFWGCINFPRCMRTING
jgi:restriction system protein